MQATGDNNITITVSKQPDNLIDENATVAAVVTKPDNSTENINFTKYGTGNQALYINTYDFDANGTWKISVTATHADYTDGKVEGYVYVGDFNLLISFVNNGQNVEQGAIGSVRNLVTNEDGNVFIGINGTVSINYPSNSVWTSNEAVTESGNGEYYYNFTAPITLGEYTATSNYTCGANTDSNNQGRFSVTSSCGSGTCDGWENCSTCPSDCGVCEGEAEPGVGPSVGPGGGGEPSIIGEIKAWIVRIDELIEVGERFDFTYKLENSTVKGESVYLEYWLEKDGKRIVSGSETTFLSSGEKREVSESLLLLGEMTGDYEFYLSLTITGKEPVVLHKPAKMMLSTPTEIELEITSLTVGKGNEPVKVSSYIGSNKDGELAILVKEEIYKGQSLVWEREQTLGITAFKRLSEEIYGLGPGNYRLEMTASYGEQVKKAEKEFEIIDEAEPLFEPWMTLIMLIYPFLLWSIIALVVAGLLYLARKKYLDRKKKRPKP